MKPTKFEGFDTVFGANQPDYPGLPGLAAERETDPHWFCWRPTFWERLQILFTGRIWHGVMAFGMPLQPQLLLTEPPMEVKVRAAIVEATRKAILSNEGLPESVRRDIEIKAAAPPRWRRAFDWAIRSGLFRPRFEFLLDVWLIEANVFVARSSPNYAKLVNEHLRLSFKLCKRWGWAFNLYTLPKR